MNVEIKKLNNQDLADFVSLIKIFEEVFEMKNFTRPNNEYLQKRLTKSNFMVIVAKEEGQVVGGLTAYVLEQYYSEKPLVYIYDLGVSTSFQRKGVGKKLIEYLIKFCSANSYEEVFVQADQVDKHALEFYRSTKITNEEKVVHFYYSLE